MEEPVTPVVPLAVERRLGPEAPVEAEPVIAGPGVRRVGVDVVQGEAETGGEPPHRGVLTGDELAVLLGVLPAVEEPAERADAAAGPGGVELVDLAGHAVPGPQPEGTAEPGDARADDHHTRAGADRRPGRRRPRRRPGGGHGDAGRRGAAQDLAPGQSPARGSVRLALPARLGGPPFRQHTGGLADVTSGLARIAAAACARQSARAAAMTPVPFRPQPGRAAPPLLPYLNSAGRPDVTRRWYARWAPESGPGARRAGKLAATRDASPGSAEGDRGDDRRVIAGRVPGAGGRGHGETPPLRVARPAAQGTQSTTCRPHLKAVFRLGDDRSCARFRAGALPTPITVFPPSATAGRSRAPR